MPLMTEHNARSGRARNSATKAPNAGVILLVMLDDRHVIDENLLRVIAGEPNAIEGAL